MQVLVRLFPAVCLLIKPGAQFLVLHPLPVLELFHGVNNPVQIELMEIGTGETIKPTHKLSLLNTDTEESGCRNHL